jgi:hypothetical protein
MTPEEYGKYRNDMLLRHFSQAAQPKAPTVGDFCFGARQDLVSPKPPERLFVDAKVEQLSERICTLEAVIQQLHDLVRPITCPHEPDPSVDPQAIMAGGELIVKLGNLSGRTEELVKQVNKIRDELTF